MSDETPVVETPAPQLCIVEKKRRKAGPGGNSFSIKSTVAAVVGPADVIELDDANEICREYNKTSTDDNLTYAVEERPTVNSIELFKATIAKKQRYKDLKETYGKIPPSVRAKMAERGQLDAEEVAEFEAMESEKQAAKDAEKAEKDAANPKAETETKAEGKDKAKGKETAKA
jgi:membrane protein involved in colicin uptake